jgi:DNA-binding transcriptional regulator YiaG
MNQERFSKLIGVNRVTLSRWESGWTLPPPMRCLFELVLDDPERALRVLGRSRR